MKMYGIVWEGFEQFNDYLLLVIQAVLYYVVFQYWSLCSQFPGVSTHWPSAQSGLVLQELGQAIQILATRYSLDLLPQGRSELVVPLTSSPSEEKKTGGHASSEEMKTYSHNGGASNTTDVHCGTNHTFPGEVGEKTCEDNRNVGVDCSPKHKSHSCPDHRDTDEVGQEEAHTVGDVGVGWNYRGQNTEVLTDTLCRENVRRDSKGRSDGFIDTLPLSSKTSKSVQQSGNVKKDAENTEVPRESSEFTGCKVSGEVAVSESKKMENITSDDMKNVSQSGNKTLTDLSRSRIRTSENKSKVLDEYTKIPGTSGEGEEGEQKGKQRTVEATFSPAHSRESMKTVGPLEKVSDYTVIILCPCSYSLL